MPPLRLAVIGARPGSLGAAVAKSFEDLGGVVATAGISGEEYRLDAFDNRDVELEEFFAELKPHRVLCTVGINGRGDDWAEHFAINVISPMRLLAAWKKHVPHIRRFPGHFAAVSSNSAHIPRTGSGAYCASKAALSMALRVAAREAAGEVRRFPTLDLEEQDVVIYGYEPGLLRGTPMTAEVRGRFDGPLTRMRGAGLADGIEVEAMANIVVANFVNGGPELNGCMIRVDAGEV